ncbi:CDP-glycerol glycerophosphotransferase family protein [Candidatus Woesearchaeota archaeon]|nr:CDP-glycerol glycerophosphotransferase family protein [Candidatus Woesearchaeota archaeon]MCF8013130.1 CDP-glycerol glycerophosphotransferase family protein [Candidatus Woesearchaeota archaeon]
MKKIIFMSVWDKTIHNMVPIAQALDKEYTFKLIHFGSLYNKNNNKHYFEKNIEVIDYSKYQKNSIINILKKEKPSLIMIEDKGGILFRSFCYAAKALKIPIIQYQHGMVPDENIKQNDPFLKNNFVKIIKKIRQYTIQLKKYLESATKYDKNFLLKKRSWFYLSKFTNPMKYYYYYRDEIQADKCLCYGLKDKEFYIKRDGYKPEDVIVVGNPQFDSTFEKLNWNKEKIFKIKEKLGFKREDKMCLLITQPLGKDKFGNWTTEKQKRLTTEIYEELNKQKIKLLIKIHPREELKEYDYLKNNVTITQENLDEMILISDFVLGGFSTALYNAIILKKQIIMPNWIEEMTTQFDYEKYGLAKKINNRNLMKKAIQEIYQSKQKKEQERTKFIKNFMYKEDGKALGRITEIIKGYKNV